MKNIMGENQILFLLMVLPLILLMFFLYLNNKRMIRAFLSIIIIMEGFAIILLPNKAPFLFGIFLIILGTSLSFFVIKDRIPNLHNSLFQKYEEYFIYIGITLLSSILIINYIILKNEFGQIDLLGSILALYFITFKFIPNEYNKEKEILFIFLNLTFFFFLLIMVFASKSWVISPMASDNVGSGWNYNEYMVNIFLARPLGNFLSLLGYEVLVDRDTLIYQDLTLGYTQRVWIADDCSGIYSMLIFISLYMSYIIVDYQKLDFMSMGFFFLGIIAAYFANILRMAVIILAGHYWGSDALYWTHVNAGWLIFTSWLLIFWLIIINVLGIKKIELQKSDIK